MDLGLTLTGERAVTLRFAQFPRTAHARLYAALVRIEQRLEAAVKAQEPVRSGAMRNMTGGRVYEHETRIAAVVGVRAPNPNDSRKAAALEYGSARTIELRAHQMKLDHIWSRAISPINVSIPTHSRSTNIAAERFLRGPIEEIMPQAIAEMQAALDEAVAESNA